MIFIIFLQERGVRVRLIDQTINVRVFVENSVRLIVLSCVILLCIIVFTSSQTIVLHF